jgi:hypothetical protein
MVGGQSVAFVEQGPALVDADGERKLPIGHQAPGQIDPENPQLPLHEPDAEAPAAVEIEMGTRGCIDGIDDPGGIEEQARSEEERSGAIEGTVAGEARVDDPTADAPTH